MYFVDRIWGEQPKAPEYPRDIDPAVFEGTNYLRHWYKKMINLPEFDHLKPVGEVLTRLNPNLSINKKKDALIYSTADHAHRSSGEDPDIFDAITNLTIEAVGNDVDTDEYWWGSLEALLNSPAGLSRRAGYHPESFILPQPSTTNGGAEIQKTLPALALHRALILKHKGNTRFHPKFDKSPEIDRPSVVTNADNLIKKVKANASAIFKGLLFKEPILPKHQVISHNINVIAKDGEFTVREITDLEKEKVRYFRPGQEGTGWYLDVPLRTTQNLDSSALGDILKFTGEDTAAMGLTGTWTPFTEGDKLVEWDQEPPFFSISSGAAESGNKALLTAIECGNGHNIDISYNRVIVSHGHLFENGGSAKLGVLAAAAEFHARKEAGEPLAPDLMPKTELRPPYLETELPSPLVLMKLELMLRLARKLKIPAHVYHKNLGLNRMLESFQIQDLRSRFEEIVIPDGSNIVQAMNLLNSTFHENQKEAVDLFVSENKSVETPLGEEGKDVLYKLVAHKFTLHHMLGIKFAQFLGLGAFNSLPLIAKNELSHDALPVEMDINNHDKVKFFQTEQALGLLGVPLYNLYKSRTSPGSWRNWMIIGAENLGQVFSGRLADLFKPAIHMSSLDSPKRKVVDPVSRETKIVEIADFVTAFPTEEQYVYYAYADFIYHEGDAYYVRPTFRTYLRPNLLESLPVEKSPEFDLVLESVEADLLVKDNEADRNEIHAQVMALRDRWTDLAREFGITSADRDADLTGNSIILSKLTREYQDKLRTSRDSNKIYKSFQVLLAASVRLDQLRLLKAAVTYE